MIKRYVCSDLFMDAKRGLEVNYYVFLGRNKHCVPVKKKVALVLGISNIRIENF